MPTTSFLADCQDCRFHSDDETPLDIKALDLVDQIPWDFLDAVRANPTKRVDRVTQGGRKLAHWYNSTDLDPCDLKALDGALNHVVLAVMTTEKRWDREGIVGWLNWVRGRVLPPGLPASIVLELSDNSPDELLNFAAALWFEAAHRFDMYGGTRRDYWMHPLLCCHFYLGTLSGPKSMFRQSRIGGENGAAFGDRIVTLVLENLRDVRDGEFKTLEDVCLKLLDKRRFKNFSSEFEKLCNSRRHSKDVSLEDTLAHRRSSKQRRPPVRSAELNQELHEQIQRVTGKTPKEVAVRKAPRKKAD